MMIVYALLLFVSSIVYAQQNIQIDLPVKTQSLTVKHGESFTIRRPSNPSTGYSNFITQIDPKYIYAGKKEYTPRATKSGMVGTSGIDTFNFKALKKGETQLIIEYMRPWEKQQPARRDIYMITIE